MEKNVFSRLILFRNNIYNVNLTSASLFYVNLLFNTNKITYFFFRFACRLYSMLGAALAKVQQQSASIAQFHFPLYLFSIEGMSWWKCSPCSSLTAPQLSGKKSKCDEGSVFLVTCCSLISGVYKLLIVLSPSVSQKYFYYKFKTVPSDLFVALKELVEEFALNNVSYLWTNESTFFQFCLTQSGELFS